MINSVLFALIGLLMLAGTGMGAVSLSNSVLAREGTDTEVELQTGELTQTPVSGQVQTQTNTVAKTKAPNKIAATPSPVVITQNTQAVSAGASIAVYVDDCEREDEDADEDDWEGDDEDDFIGDCIPGATTSAPATTLVAPAPQVVATTPAPQSAPAPAPTPTPAPTQAPGTYTMAQVATHNTGANCWSAISGSVYNLTSFVSQHPGGSAAIKSLCGVDGTAAYSAQHGGASRPANELASLKVGIVVQ